MAITKSPLKETINKIVLSNICHCIIDKEYAVRIKSVNPFHLIVVNGRVFINNDTAVEHPKADPGFVSPVLVAHLV